MASRHLAIDIGASSGRAIVGELDETGRLRLTEVHRFENGLVQRAGHLCWDIDALWESVLHGLTAAHEQGLTPATVGIDTWGVDFVLLDAQDRRIGEAVGYRDARTQGVREELERTGVLPFSEHYARTGIQYQPFNTAYQLCALKHEHPEQLAAAHAFLMVPDYLNFLLCGEKANEYTNASTTALVGATSRDWDRELLARLGLPADIFLPACMPGCSLGHLRPEVARRVGFDSEVVLPATHDTGSAFLAVPARDDHAAFLSSGTWSLLGTELAAPVTTPASAAANFTNEGGYQARYRYLKNIMGLWMIQCVRRESARPDGTLPSWGELVSAAEFAHRQGPRALVDAEDARFLSPRSMVAEVRSACSDAGQPVPATTGEVACVVYDSLAADYARTVHQMEGLTDTSFTSVNIVGGGSANAYLNQATANACNLPVYAGPTEGTALGNLIVQMIHAGELEDLASARAAIASSFDIKEVLPHE
ncbi:rhamnulokinase [Olsenella sp. AF16-14LB]|uniref:rhamnulokinase n=1 Tax=unclassified Olsenella TaxID=2638792 RepID=UPI000E51DBF1|nr:MULTISPECIES: rhamnulokinase [unclassified Olsenella]RGU48627.1 rhamnulokinase [Olsenella sp. AF16-14LB]RGU80677.1 rhamnulokinase [Olsenella sp. AF15-43LB]